MTESSEQLRRLKNTIMGVSYRLQRLAESRTLPAEARPRITALAADLAESSRRLGSLLAVLGQARSGAGVEGSVDRPGGQHGDDQEAGRQDEQDDDGGPAA